MAVSCPPADSTVGNLWRHFILGCCSGGLIVRHAFALLEVHQVLPLLLLEENGSLLLLVLERN